MLVVTMMVTSWESNRAEAEGFPDPDARAVQVRDAVCETVGWDHVHDAIVEVLDEYPEWCPEAVEEGLVRSGYLEVRDELFPETLPPPATPGMRCSSGPAVPAGSAPRFGRPGHPLDA
jgi:hypothetical protein